MSVGYRCRRLENVETLAEGLSKAAAEGREVDAVREGVEAERFAALAKGVRDVRGELQLLKDNQELRAQVGRRVVWCKETLVIYFAPKISGKVASIVPALAHNSLD